ncbi:hypothetical protein [Vulcanisaeta distributa]|uniref:hypothetical protein n=1 Tax=Vulcanisaeta distributa TaxID=164451 RepID=UPI001494B164|nr:hypothetical protein [Vulcanisaeta distributa]
MPKAPRATHYLQGIKNAPQLIIYMTRNPRNPKTKPQSRINTSNDLNNSIT